MIIQEEWESVLAEYQQEHGEPDPLVALMGEQCFVLGCAFMFQVIVDAFQNRNYQALALIKDEILTYHEQNGDGNGQPH